MKRRILSLITALAMCLSLCPAWTLAAEGERSADTAARSRRLSSVGDRDSTYTTGADTGLDRANSPARTAGVTVSICGTQMVSGVYTINDGNAGVTKVNDAPTDGTPYLAYDSGTGTLTVHGGVQLKDSAEDPTNPALALNVTGGELTITGGAGDSLTLTAENGTYVISSASKVRLDGGVNFTAKISKTGICIPAKSTLSTADTYTGSISVNATGENADAVEGTLNITSAGNVNIYSTHGNAINVTRLDDGAPPSITAAGDVQIMGDKSAVTATRMTINSRASVTIESTGEGAGPAIDTSVQADITAAGDVIIRGAESAVTANKMTINSSGSVTIESTGEGAGPAINTFAQADITAAGDVTINSAGQKVLNDTSSLNVTSTGGNVTIIGGGSTQGTDGVITGYPAFADPSKLTVTAKGDIEVRDRWHTADYTKAVLNTTGSGAVIRPGVRDWTVDLGHESWATEKGIYISIHNGAYEVAVQDGGSIRGSLAYTNLTITGTAKKVHIMVTDIPESGSVTLKDLHIDNSDASSGPPLIYGAVAGAPPQTTIGIEGDVELIGSLCAVAAEGSLTLTGGGNFTAAVKDALPGSGNAACVTLNNKGSLNMNVAGDVAIRMESTNPAIPLFGNQGSDNTISIKGKNVTLAKTNGAPAYQNGVANAGVTVTASGNFLAMPVVSGTGGALDFSAANADPGDLATKGYQWDDSSKTLRLKNIYLSGTVTLPDTDVTIETKGNCIIDTLAGVGTPSKTKITFKGVKGNNQLTIQQRVNICGGNGNSLTVAEDAHVIANGGIAIGADGAVDGEVTVNGILTAEGQYAGVFDGQKAYDSAISTGQVVVGSHGELNVKGVEGVALNGMRTGPDGALNFENVFTVEKGGTFSANCTEYNLRVNSGLEGGFPPDSNWDKAINVPVGYMPESCEKRKTENNQTVKLYKKDTNDEYTGMLTIHEKHDWSKAEWKYNETEHWQECTVEGCGKETPRVAHTLPSTWKSDGDNHWQKCTVCGGKISHGAQPGKWIDTDDNEHWRVCTVCGLEMDRKAHTYDDDADTTCNDCGHTRHIHSWEETWSKDGTHHWKKCTVDGCTVITQYGEHVYDDDADTTCNICEYERTVEPDQPGPGPGPEPDPEPVPPPIFWTGGSGGGSSTGTHTVTVEKPEHGKVTSSRTSAGSGSTVTLTATPDDGYVLDTLTVTDSKGNAVELTDQGGGKYAFTMPGRAVTVKAAFAPLPEDTETVCDGGENCPSRGFTDVGSVGTWYHEAVDYVLRNGLMSGYDSGLFGPDNPLSRAQFAQILYNREGRPAVAEGSIFTDVAPGAWYAPAITWAVERGIVDGYGDGRFGPNDSITREQLAVMLWRYAGSPAATDEELHFNDADKAGKYALDALRWAVENGVVGGKGGGTLDPKGLATRAQAAQMLQNYLEP